MMEKSIPTSTTQHGGSNNMTKNNKKKKAADPSTLFVKFHPPSASITRQHLSNYFSYWGPVNKCSVIRNKSSSKQQVDGEDNNGDNSSGNVDRGSKGYGFVRFVNEEDAISAANAIKKLQQQQQSRGKKKKGKDTSSSGEEYMVVDGVQYRIHAERAVDAELQNKKGNNNSTQKKNEQVANKVTPPTKSTTSNTTTTTSSSATPSSTTKNNTIDPETLYKTESKRKRTSRVIIRNLSFYANESHIKKCMEENFGPVSVVDLPLVPSLPGEDNDDNNNGKGKTSNKQQRAPRHRGFAFVTFTNSNAAKLAVDREEEIKIKNRVVAIDFSVSKAEHQRMQREGAGKEEEDSESESDSESENEEKDSNGSADSSSSSSDDDTSDSEDDSSSNSDDESESENEEDNEDKAKVTNKKDETKDDEPTATPTFDTENESKRTLFLRNIPFDATRHDVFELFRKFGRIEGVYLVKDKMTGVFKGTAFVRFESEEGCMAAMEASGSAIGEETQGDHQQFVSSKNMAMGSAPSVGASSLTLKGRSIFIDLAVDRTTASSLAIQRDDEGKPIKKMIGKDRRNLYLKNEGRVSSSTESGSAKEASAKHGGLWEDLPSGDRSKRERAFADKSTKLRSPLFFINPNRISIRNLAKHITESELKSLVFGALKKGLEEGLVTPQDAVAHWRAGGELPHAEVMRRATDPTLVMPPVDEKNVKESVASVYIDRDVSGGKKTVDAPSRGFGFVELVHHTHALAVLRQLNNNPIYSAQYAAGGKHASESSKRGRKGKKGKVDPETGDELVNDDQGKIPRLIVEFAVENKVKARKQAEKVAQTKANKIKQRIEKKEKEQQDSTNDKKKEKKKGRGTLQREKKRARKEAGESGDKIDDSPSLKKQKLDHGTKADKSMEKKPKMVKPQKKKRKVNAAEEQLEDMIRSYKSSFSQGGDSTSKKSLTEGVSGDTSVVEQPKKKSREQVAKKRWFE